MTSRAIAGAGATVRSGAARLVAAFAAFALVAGCELVRKPPPAAAPQRVAAPLARPDPVAPAPDPLVAFYADMEGKLTASGRMRLDTAPADVPFTADDLVRNFERIALYDEYVDVDGRLVRRETPASLRRWDRPVRVGVVVGRSVSRDMAARHHAEVSNFAARLARLTGLDIRVTDGPDANFLVTILSTADQAVAAETTARQFPSFQPAVLEALGATPLDTSCITYVFDEPSRPSAFATVMILIRAEHPPLTRLSCVHEEMAQAMGLLNDSPDARPSIFNGRLEFAFLTEHDEILLRMLYDPRLQPGMSLEEARPLLPPIARDAMAAKRRAGASRACPSTEALGPETPIMPIFDFLRGEFIDVIHWVDDTRDTIVWRFERQGHAIKYGAKLTVREGQAAVFVHEGQIADVFEPGLYQLETNNMPVMTTLQHWGHGFQSPFKSEIYFVNTRRFTDMKWGTRNPITCRDPEFGMVRLRAFGTYTMRVTDPAKFMTEIVGTDGEFTTQEIEFQIRNLIVTHFSQIIATSGIPVLDMAANTIDLAQLVHERIAPMVAEYGLELPGFLIENVSLPTEVEGALDKRTSMGVIGDLNRFTEFSAAEAMTKSAENPRGDGGLSAGLGAGLGMALAGRMARGPWGQAPAQAAPPPPPGGKTWHIAENGATKGPYTRAELAQMAASGAVTPDTYLWTQGSADWRRGREVGELADLFDAPPPPPPAG